MHTCVAVRWFTKSALTALLLAGVVSTAVADELDAPRPHGIDFLQPLDLATPPLDAAPAADAASLPRAAWMVDDFEDGNIDGWIDEGGDACYAGTSALAAFGAYSMRVDGACAHRLGRYLDISGSRPTGIAVWVRSETNDTHDTYFILGDHDSGPGGNSGAIYFHGSLNAWSVFDGVSHSCGPRNPGQWYQVTFNVDWACKMYDVSIDGVLKQRNIPFYHQATGSFDMLHVYNWSSGTVARYDSISFSTPGISPLIFEDDFERTSTCHWSTTAP